MGGLRGNVTSSGESQVPWDKMEIFREKTRREEIPLQRFWKT